jgi:serine/threonine protein kinase
MEPLSGDDPAEIGGYRLRARLGAGGMGRVYLASTPGGRRVAIKVVRPELGDDPDFRTRFRQEIAAAQRVRGLYTAELLSADPDATPPFLITAYVPGPSLQRAVADHGPMPAETVIRLVAGVAEALQVIHAAGVVHRDLKPSNVLLAPDGPRVIDFGIARAAEATSVTGSGIRVGSPQFMAPEQIRGTTATPAVDVFALGSVAAFTLLGRVPFGEGNPAALMHRVLNAEPNLTGCTGPIRDLIAGCLAKDPAARPDPTQIIETCRTLAEGNLGDFAESWWPTLSTPAQLGTVAEPQLGAPSPSPSASSGPGLAAARSSPPPAAPPPAAQRSAGPAGSAGSAGVVPPEWARPQPAKSKGKGKPAAARRGLITPGKPATQGIPGAPGALGTPGASGASGAPGIPGALGTPSNPGASRTPGSTGTPGSSSAPGASRNSGAPANPRTPGNSTNPRASGTSGVYKNSGGSTNSRGPGTPPPTRVPGGASTAGTPTGSRPAPGSTGPRSRNGVPTGPRSYPAPGRLPIPTTVVNAAKFMYGGVGLAVLGLLAGLGTLHSLRTLIEQQNPNASQSYVSASIGAAVVTLVLLGGIGALLWLWMARLTRRGEHRARTLSTIVFVVATVGGIHLISQGETTRLSAAFGLIEWAVGLIAIVLLWSSPSRRYFNALGPPGPNPPRSPSLRQRAEDQRAHPTERDWPAQRR